MIVTLTPVLDTVSGKRAGVVTIGSVTVTGANGAGVSFDPSAA